MGHGTGGPGLSTKRLTDMVTLCSMVQVPGDPTAMKLGSKQAPLHWTDSSDGLVEKTHKSFSTRLAHVLAACGLMYSQSMFLPHVDQHKKQG